MRANRTSWAGTSLKQSIQIKSNDLPLCDMIPFCSDTPTPAQAPDCAKKIEVLPNSDIAGKRLKVSLFTSNSNAIMIGYSAVMP